MIERAGVWLLSIGLVCVLCACDPAHPCDPGYHADHGACVRRAPTRPAGDDDDAGIDGQVAVFAGDYSDFGLACTDSSECGGAAPWCLAPNFPVCTNFNCMTDPKLCPPSWHCLDITSFTPDPSVNSVCVNF